MRRQYALLLLFLISLGIVPRTESAAEAAPLSTGAGVAPGGGCPPNWQVVSSPSPGDFYNELSAVSAVSANDVWAVGRTLANGGNSHNLIVHWNGTAWIQVVAPTIEPYDNALTTVSARAANDVWAAGQYYTSNNSGARTVILHWDGTSWTVVPSPNPASTYNLLSGVVALTATNAWAVGSYRDDATTLDRTLMLHWDGTIWSVAPSANMGTGTNNLSAIAASSATDLWAVGSYQASTGGVTHSLTLHGDGTTWTVVTSPNIGTGNNALHGVLALAANNAWAVGAYDGIGPTQQGLILHWDGSAWTQVPVPAGPGALLGVAGTGPTDLWAVGFTPGSPSYTLAMHWDGAAWSQTPTPNVTTYSNVLSGVVALAPATVWAVGSDSTGSLGQTLVLGYSTVCPPPTATATASPTPTPCSVSWSAVPVPNVTRQAGVFGMAASGADDVWAVGSYYDTQSNGYSLIEHWNGSTWTVSSTLSLTASLRDVLVISTTNAWATGGNTIDHWDGTTWTAVANPAPADAGDLYALAAVNANDIWAVGRTASGSVAQSYTMHWDGTAWSRVPSPNVPPGHTELYGVTARATNDVWAVGVGNTSQSLILHWDGSTWTVVPSPAVGSGYNWLWSVAAVGPNDAWAVGDVQYGAQPLILHWNGSAWTAITSPALTYEAHLRGLAVVAANDIWAAGFDGIQVPHTLLDHWDGTSWQVVPAELAPPYTSSQLWDIVAIGARDLWAGGRTVDSDPGVLIAHGGRFSDVIPTDYYYHPVNVLVAVGAIGGYPDCTFRPFNNVTRAQAAKILAAAAGYSEPVPNTQQSFEDVTPGSTFWVWIERITNRGIIQGYPCGGVGEPCISPTNRPYFRPNNNLTRGQLAKITANAAGYNEPIPSTQQTFEDTLPGSTFWLYVERSAGHGVISGYPCGTAGEPCLPPGNRPYFRPVNNVTRGQTAKIIANTLLTGP